MSDSEKLPHGTDSSDKSAKPGSPRRPERSGNQNLLWYGMISLVILALAFSFANPFKKTETLEISEFISKLEANEFDSRNIFELKIGREAITFQDHPKERLGESSGATIKRYSIPVLGMTDKTKERLEGLLEKAKVPYGYPDAPSEWVPLLTFFGLMILSILAVVFIIRRIAGPGAAMSFGRSRGKLYAQEDLGVTFDDVAGTDEAVEELREIVEFLRSPGKYQALGGRIPRGVLLVGPPGTGKTLLAKAVAGEAGVPFFSLSGSDFVEMFVGVGASRVRDLFAQAVTRAPAIIFIDELDALGKRRGEGGPGNHDERDQTLNALLVEMDGFSSDQSVIVMGATNRPETLDPALMRPGRFDRHVLVDRPDVKGREAILKVHVKNVKTDDSVDVKTLAKITPGFVGADLANLVNEAALLAARKNKNRVTKEDFQEGVERVVAGLEKRTRIIPDDEKKRVAYHEIGHTLVAMTLPHVDPVHKVSIIPRGFGALGYMLHFPENDRNLSTKTELHNRICVMLGGIAVENLVFQEGSTGPANDLERATELARRMVTEFGMSSKLGLVHYSDIVRSPFLSGGMPNSSQNHSEDTIREIDLEIRKIIDTAYQTAFDIVSSRRTALEHLTRELLEQETMDAEQIKAIVDQYQTGPVLNPGTIIDAPVPQPESFPSITLPATGSDVK